MPVLKVGKYAGGDKGVESMSAIAQPRTFAHEVGHSLGLRHEYPIDLENGIKYGDDYLKLLGQRHQKAINAAINDVLSRGPINYSQMYYSGGNEIMFSAPRLTGELPAKIHFR
jgi:hypothetical protein